MSRSASRGWGRIKSIWGTRLTALVVLGGGVQLLGQAACATDATTESGDAGANGGNGSGGGSGGSGDGGSGAFDSDAKIPTEVRIATFNARNLFNDKIDGEAGILDEADSTPSSADYQRKLRDTASLLAMLNAQVIMLEEVENREVLDALADRPELGGAFPHRYTIAGNDPRGIDVALLSALPIEARISHRDEYFPRIDRPDGPKYRYARDCLEIHLRVAGRPLILLGVHFKAKSSDDPDKRLAEAQHTRLIADTLVADYPDAALVILGDFNDFPGSPPVDALDGSGSSRFVSAARQLPASDAWSVDSFSGSGVLLHDDLIVNPLLSGYYVNGSADIIHDDEVSADLADLSDHAPVAATYLIQPLL